jgi:hypothetical protein
MARTLPSGLLSLDTAVELIARTRNLYPTIVYRDEADAAWRKLCALSKDHVRPLLLTADELIQKADRTQFLGFADKYWKFASVLRYTPNGEGVPQEVNVHCPSHDILDETGRLHRGARFVFLESEIKTVMAVEPPAVQASDAEIDEMIRSADKQFKRRVGLKKLWEIAQQKEINCTEERLDERTRKAERTYPPSKGRPKNCPE